MGGMREEVLSPCKRETVLQRPTGIPPATGLPPSIRMHESGNEVHFHDDLNKIKCAIDITDFYSLWRSERYKLFQGSPVRIYGHDGQGGMSLLIIRNIATAPNIVQLECTIERAESDPIFKAIDNFASGK